jgi:sporulation protein YlmC with PRC-barrel domain
MNRFKLTSVVCGGLLSLGTSLLAQQPSTSPTSPSQSSSFGQSSTYRQNAATGAADRAGHWQHSGQKSVRLGDLMNATVQSKDGKTLGYIRDFTINPQSGHIEFAVLSTSPTETATGTSAFNRGTTATAAAGQLIPVPWQLFSQSWTSGQKEGVAGATTPGMPGTHNLVLNIDESKLQGAPSFNSSDWNELRERNFDQRVYTYFGVNRMSGAGAPGTSVSGQGTIENQPANEGARGGAKDLNKEPIPQK